MLLAIVVLLDMGAVVVYPVVYRIARTALSLATKRLRTQVPVPSSISFVFRAFRNCCRHCSLLGLGHCQKWLISSKSALQEGQLGGYLGS